MSLDSDIRAGFRGAMALGPEGIKSVLSPEEREAVVRVMMPELLEVGLEVVHIKDPHFIYSQWGWHNTRQVKVLCGAGWIAPDPYTRSQQPKMARYPKDGRPPENHRWCKSCKKVKDNGGKTKKKSYAGS